MNKNRFNQLLESKMGNVMPLLIVEEDDSKIDNFLKKYQDKTINLYLNPECTEYDVTGKIVNIKYLEYPNNTKDHYLAIEIKHEFSEEEYTFEYSVECNYNPSKFSNKFSMSAASELLQEKPYEEKYIFNGDYDRYNKSFVNDIFNKGSQLGIQFCKKPNADFGMTNSPNSNLT